MIWTQDTQNGIPGVVVPQEQVSSVLVATVTVGGSTQPSAPTLASITPAQVQQGGTVSVMLMGTGFVAGATSVNVPAGVSVSNVVVGSATMLTATFVVAPSLSGSFPVFVATANGTSGSLPFTIIPQAFQSWQPFTPAFERLFDSVTGPLNQIRVCASDGKCSAPMPIQ
jgi:hypothetical protein